MSSDKLILVKPSEDQLKSIKRDVKCTQEGCSRTFIHDGALKMHLVKSHGQIENVCKFQNDADKRLFHRGKVRNKESWILQFKCPIEKCQYSSGKDRHFSAYHQLKQHYMKVHAERSFSCSKCERDFSRESDCVRHELHCGVMFGCADCPVKYTTTEALITHCKRQGHTYPQEYCKKEKRTKKGKASVCSSTNTIMTIPVIPAVLINVLPPPPSQPPPLKQLKPKLPVVSMSDGRVSVSSDGSNSTLVSNCAPRQDALIQTDIFGINSLSVSGHGNHNESGYSVKSGREYHVNETVQSSRGSKKKNLQSGVTGIGSSRSPSKKTPAAKRKLGLSNDLCSPRKKKTKSTTGMQTSVSLTRKPRMQSVCGTQTTGDYILKSAMAHARIPIERKTVASQVTNEKQPTLTDANKKCTIETQTFLPVVSSTSCPGPYYSKPVLVDSYSQVKQRNIWAETSHNLAESQTMTDLPPSISTQTLQSYLVNLQERKLSQRQLSRNKGNNHVNTEKKPLNYINTAVKMHTPNRSKQNVNLEGDSHSVVQIYGTNLSTSVKYIASETVKGKQYNRKLKKDRKGPNFKTTSIDQVDETAESKARFVMGKDKVSESALDQQPKKFQSLLSTETDFIEAIGLESAPKVHRNYTTSDPFMHAAAVGVSSGSTVLEKSVNTMTDTEAQAMMSADEFESLLHSSGIFLDNSDITETTTRQASKYKPFVSSHNKSADFDLLHCGASTADINTQTAGDLNLFESYTSIDTNTQTGGEIDFLDLVMNNMETQTLNDDDLIDLGLAGISSSTSTQTLGVGTSDTDWMGPSSHLTQYCSSDCTDDLMQTNKLFRPIAQENQSENNEQLLNQSTNLKNSDDKVTSQMETQTTWIETTEQYLQTETQTQVDLQDTDLITTNMETQTTLEDLQQLCDWFD